MYLNNQKNCFCFVRYFEWFIDVLRDVERKDVTNVLEMHIFITQFFHKFDLRTTMLVKMIKFAFFFLACLCYIQ